MCCKPGISPANLPLNADQCAEQQRDAKFNQYRMSRFQINLRQGKPFCITVVTFRCLDAMQLLSVYREWQAMRDLRIACEFHFDE